METLFLSHRGESDDAPENTLAAFQLAMDRDSDGIELDIRLTSDKKIICIHDASLKRVAGIDAAVADHTLTELQKIHPVPLLREVWGVLKPGVMLQIELKSTTELLPLLAAEFPADAAERFDVRLSSFQPDLLAAAADFFPALPRLLLIDLEKRFEKIPSVAEAAALLKECRATGVSMRANLKFDADFIKGLRTSGFECVAWGVSSDELGLHMAETGVSAMTCNHAVALRKLWRSRATDQEEGKC